MAAPNEGEKKCCKYGDSVYLETTKEIVGLLPGLLYLFSLPAA